MTRIDYFRLRTAEHVLYKRLALKLSEAEFDQCVDFIEEHDHLDHLQFERKINRLFLDREHKPKNWTIIQELLMVANGCKLNAPKHRSHV